MHSRSTIVLFLLAGVLSLAGRAVGQDSVHSYLNETAQKVKAAESPIAKRAILTEDLESMTEALTRAENSSLTSAQDDAGLARIRSALQEKRDELAGANGFERVPDSQLNGFATFVVQDMEQAERMVTMSLVTALLIVILIILIA